MTRFKSHQPDKRRSGSVDGFAPSGNNTFARQGSIGFENMRRHTRQARTPQPSQTAQGGGQVDNFRRANGWYGAAQPKLTAEPHTQQSNMLPTPEPRGGHNAPQHAQPTLFAPGLMASAGKTKSRKKRNIKKIVKRTALALTVLTIVGGGAFVAMQLVRVKGIFKGGGDIAVALNKDVDPSQLKSEGDGRVNILLLGKGGENHPGGELTDTILVASIDPIQNEAGIISIPRDLYVKVPSQGSMKINSVHYIGSQAYINEQGNADKAAVEKAGTDLLEETIETVLGVPIHYNVTVDFTAFKEAVDAVGGIDITLDDAIYDPNFDWEYGRNALKLAAGANHLDGQTALLLGRARGAAGGYGVGTDFDRNENQRKMLIALKEKIFSLGTFGNPAKIASLVSAFSNHVSTNFSTDELMRLYEIGKAIDTSKISSIDLVQPPNSFLTTSQIDGLSVVLPKEGFEEYAAIHAFVASALRDGYLKKEDASIVVLNGSLTPGLAATKANELKGLGYTILSTANAPTSDYQATQIIDLSGDTKKYTRRYLEQRFGVTVGTTLPDPAIDGTNADFVVILGANEGANQ